MSYFKHLEDVRRHNAEVLAAIHQIDHAINNLARVLSPPATPEPSETLRAQPVPDIPSRPVPGDETPTEAHDDTMRGAEVSPTPRYDGPSSPGPSPHYGQPNWYRPPPPPPPITLKEQSISEVVRNLRASQEQGERTQCQTCGTRSYELGYGCHVCDYNVENLASQKRR